MRPASGGALAATPATEPATETPVSPTTDAGMSSAAQIIEDDEQFTRSTAPTNLYTDEEWCRIKHALAAYEQIEKDLPRHRHDWLHVIGPTLVMVRAKAFEVSGTTNVKSPHYQDAIREELKRTGLDAIHKTTRSYLLKIMDNLSDVEVWLANDEMVRAVRRKTKKDTKEASAGMMRRRRTGAANSTMAATMTRSRTMLNSIYRTG
jgi:hypothetical protein